jgi:hypothetical protein
MIIDGHKGSLLLQILVEEMRGIQQHIGIYLIQNFHRFYLFHATTHNL